MLAADSLEDQALLNALESLRLDAGTFNHRSHLWLGRVYLKRLPLHEAAHRSARLIRRFAVHHGAAGKFHLIMTLAFIHLIYERMQQVTPSERFAEFCARNPDLLNNARGLLPSYYSESALADPAARSIFALPDRRALPAMQE